MAPPSTASKKTAVAVPTVIDIQVFTNFALSSAQCMKQGWTRPIEPLVDEETVKCRMYNDLRIQFDSVKRIFLEQAETLARQRDQLYAIWRFGHGGHIQSRIFVQRLALRKHRRQLSILARIGSPFVTPRLPLTPWWPASQRPSVHQRYADACNWLPSHPSSQVRSTTQGDTGGNYTPHGLSNMTRQTTESRAQSRFAMGMPSTQAAVLPSSFAVEESRAASAASGGVLPSRPWPERTLPASGLNSPVAKFGRGKWGTEEKLLRIAIKGGLDCLYCVASKRSEETFHYVFDDTRAGEVIAIAAFCSGFTRYWRNGEIHFYINDNMGVSVQKEPGITTAWTGDPPWWKKGTTYELKLNEVVTFRYKGRRKMSLMYHTNRDHVVIDLSQSEYRPVDSGDDGEVLPSEMLETDGQSTYLSDTTTGGVTIFRSSQLHIERVQEEWMSLRARLKGLLRKMQELVGMAEQIPRRATILKTRAKIHTGLPTPRFSVPPPPLPVLYESSREADEATVEEADRDVAHADAEEQSRVVKILEAFLLVVSSTRERKKKPHTWSNIVERSRKFVPPACPSVLRLRLLQMDKEKKVRKRIFSAGDGRRKQIRNWPLCTCSNLIVPNVTDVELQNVIQNKDLAQQVMVICIKSSRNSSTQSEEVLTEVYRKLHRKRRKPCVQFPLDYYRLMKYDLDTAARNTKFSAPFLVRQHDVLEGMTMMFLNGRLMFCGYKFNGYGLDRCNFIKQMQACFFAAEQGFALPNDFKFGCSYPRVLESIESTTESEESIITAESMSDSMSGYESLISVHTIQQSLSSLSDKIV